MDKWDEERSQTELRFSKNNLPALKEVLQLPEKNSFIREGLCPQV